jgi:L-iditol 2-dehydrogenase
MKALVKTVSGAGPLELQEVVEPEAGPGEVLLEIGAAGICGSDLHIVAGEYPCNPPVILGHEFAGTIVSLGEGVTGWRIGDRVTSMPYAITCGACAYCRSGEFGLCVQRKSYGSGVNGAFAEYLAVRTAGLYRLPDHQDFVAGALTEPLACVTKAVFEVAGLQQGEQVVILGPGPIGLLTLQVVLAAGAVPYLIGLHSDSERLEQGQALGAREIYFADDPRSASILQERLREGADAVFECSGAGPAFDLALEVVRKKGRLIQVGLFGKPVAASLDRVVFKDLRIQGSFASSISSWKRAVELTLNRKVDTGRLVTDIFPLENSAEAFTQARERSRLKVIFQP